MRIKYQTYLYIMLCLVLLAGCRFYNDPPTASAGLDKTAVLGELVYLDGSTSIDLDKDTLSYSWTVTEVPEGSVITPGVFQMTGVNPSFTPDVAGAYVIQLVVGDGMYTDTDWVSVMVNPAVSIPESPDGLVVGNPTQISLTIEWDTVDTAATYRVYRSSTESGTYTESIYQGTNTIYIDTGLSHNTRYYYRVTALNSAGESVQTATVAGRTLP